MAPDRFNSVDGGIDQYLFHDRIRVSATIFYTRIAQLSGYIYALPQPDPFGRISGYMDMSGGISRGDELSVEARPTSTLVLMASYTYTNADTDTDSTVPCYYQMFDLPRHKVLDGRPVYRFGFGRKSTVVFADNGQLLGLKSQQMALRIASAWTELPAQEALFEGSIIKDDQWTVYSSVHPYGPFWKYSWPDGRQVYVSQGTGEVAQDTTRGSRMGAYFGAIPHWLYFTWLRRNGPLWAQVVIWVSGAGTVMSILGLVAGVWLYSPSKRYRFPNSASSVLFAGPKRWHVVLGLIFGLVTCTWVFSGLLSMGPSAWLSDPERPNLDKALRGDRIDLAAFEAKDPVAAIAETQSNFRVKELEFLSFDGQPFYLATEAPRKSVLVSMRNGYQPAFGSDQLLNSIRRAVKPASVIASRLVTRYEPYYIDRQNEKPLPVFYVELNDANRSSFYIDPRTGKVVQSYGVRSRWERWLYHGLHSMDLPALYAHRPAWDIVVLSLMLGGTALSITSLVIAWRRLRIKLFGAPRRQNEVASEQILDTGAIS